MRRDELAECDEESDLEGNGAANNRKAVRENRVLAVISHRVTCNRDIYVCELTSSQDSWSG